MPIFAISLAAEMIRSSPLSGNTIRRWSTVARRRICSTNVTSVARFRRVDSSLTEAGRSVFGPDRPVLELLRQRFRHCRMDETVQISAVLSYLAHDTRADVRGFDRRDHKHRLEILGHMPVHERHLEFILEVADRAKSTDVQLGADLLGEVYKQSLELCHLDEFVAGSGRANQIDTLFRGE